MRIGAEQLAIALQRQNVGVGVNARRVNLIPSDQLVPDLVRRIGKHQHNLTATLGDASQTDGKAIAGENGEKYAHGAAAQLGADIGGDFVHRSVVALRAGDYGFGHGNDIPVVQGKVFGTGGFQYAFGYDGSEVISLADDGAADAP